MLSMVPEWYVMAVTAVGGLLIGSFLNVVIYRFHTGRSLRGHSHCLSCQQRLRWFELLPVISYLGLRGRCRSCGAYVPVRYAVVELITAVLFVWAYWVFGLTFTLGWFLIIASILVVIAVYDYYHLVIPNQLVTWLLVAVLGSHLTALSHLSRIDVYLPHVLAAVGAFCFFGSLWRISNGRWIGFGDAKLIVPLALYVGLWGTFSLIVLSFWLGALISVGLLLVQWVRHRGKPSLRAAAGELTMKSEVPFAPFLIMAFYLVVLAQVDVLRWFSTVL